MSRKKIIFPLLILVSLLSNAYSTSILAQDSTRYLSLNEAITNSLQNNQSVQLAEMDEKIAGARYKQTEAIYLPQIALSYTAMSTNNPLNAFGFKLQQKSISGSDFNPDLLNHPSGTPDFSTKIDVLQPIVNLDIWYQKKAAATQTEMYQLQTTRTREFISFEVQKAYLQLAFTYDMVSVLEEALQTTKAVNKFTSDHFEQGLIQRSDVLNTEVQIKTVETNLSKARSNIKNASDYLSLLMHLPTGIIYSINKNEVTIKGAQKMEIADTRADFLAMQKAIMASDFLIESNKKSYLPRLNAFGSYQLNDSRMLGFGSNAYLAGVQLSWDIFKGNRTKNTIATQTLEKNKLNEQLSQQKDQNRLALNKALRDLNDSNFEILQQEKSVEQANEAFRILQNRYQQGLANTTDLLMAATQSSQQKLAKAQAIFNSNITKAYIQFLTTSNTK